MTYMALMSDDNLLITYCFQVFFRVSKHRFKVARG